MLLLSDEVACVDPEMCMKACDNPIGCSNIAYPKLVLELLPEGKNLAQVKSMNLSITAILSLFVQGKRFHAKCDGGLKLFPVNSP